MIVAFASFTGKVKEFSSHLDFKTVHIDSDTIVDEPFVLITYSIGFGQVPVEVDDFLDNNSDNMVGVVGSGDRIWGNNFCRGARIVSEEFNVPLLHTFEKSGLNSDVEIVNNKIRELERMK